MSLSRFKYHLGFTCDLAVFVACRGIGILNKLKIHPLRNGLFCGYFDWTLLDFDLFGMVPKSTSCLTIFNCIWNNFLLFDPDSHFSIHGCFVSQTNIYLAVSKYLYGLRIKKLLYSCDICK